jgi:hypothetical protein
MIPIVWSTNEPDLAAEVSPPKPEQSPRHRFEQHVVDGLLVGKDERIQLVWKSENEMEVRNGQ